MNMKIIGLNGSPHGKNSQTLRLVMKVLEGAKGLRCGYRIY